MDVHQLAPILHKSVLTVKNDLSRAPHRLPPPIRNCGKKALWIEHKVLEWLEQQIGLPATHDVKVKRRGAPTMAQRLAKARSIDLGVDAKANR